MTFILATDLDRTLIPNGYEPEDQGVRELFTKITDQPDLTTVYATGRNLDRVLEAIPEYNLPIPDYIVANVGTEIYTLTNQVADKHQAGSWSLNLDYQKHIATEWSNRPASELANYLRSLDYLEMQEAYKLNICKLSYYASLDIASTQIEAEIAKCFQELNLSYKYIYSEDPLKARALVDLIPHSASKLGALKFIAGSLNLSLTEVFFAGDSGNDLDVVLDADIQTTLVKNAHKDVLAKAQAAPSNYLARGGFKDLNGNYAAGIIEGLYNYRPELVSQVLG
jgi:HAD superfamily hydrolase (TIGR01484 family)